MAVAAAPLVRPSEDKGHRGSIDDGYGSSRPASAGDNDSDDLIKSSHSSHDDAESRHNLTQSEKSERTTDHGHAHDHDGADASDDFHAIPSMETLRAIEQYTVFDREGKSRPFKSLYTGKNIPRRVLVIFIRHFLCGNCQEFITTLSTDIQPEALLHLPVATSIVIVGCGVPDLIDNYTQTTKCPFPIYTDPTGRLFAALGMTRTLALGDRPDYQRRNLAQGMIQSIFQGLKQLPSGNALKAGDFKQVGGEFLFEPLALHTPHASPVQEVDRQLTSASPGASAAPLSSSAYLSAGTARAGALGDDDDDEVEEKKITWAHRMRSTRDHAEIPELREVLGLDGHGVGPRKGRRGTKRWERAMSVRKGKGESWIVSASSTSRSLEDEGHKRAAQDCGCD